MTVRHRGMIQKKMFKRKAHRLRITDNMKKTQSIDAFIDNGEYNNAIIAGEKLLSENPNNPRLHALIGWCYSQKKQWRDAVVFYTHALDIKKNAPSTLYNRGRAYQELGQLDKALDDYKRSAAIAPEFDILFNIASIYEMQYSWHKAREYYLQAKQLKGNDKNTNHALKNIAKKIKDFSCLRKCKEQIRTYSEDLFMAQRFITNGEFERALQIYNSLIKDNCSIFTFYKLRGICQFYISNFNAATEDFLYVISNDANDADTLFNLAQSYAFSEKFDLAIKYFIDSGKLAPRRDIFLNLKTIIEYSDIHHDRMKYKEDCPK